MGLLLVCLMFGASCSRPATPKEYGYFRIALPEHQFVPLSQPLPYAFSYNSSAQILPADSAQSTWINVYYPTLDATVHCSYLPVRHNLPQLLADAQEFVYSHSVKASAIPEQEYIDSVHHVFGIFYELEGNTATPMQFYLTDSTTHFFRAAVYINTIPNQDSLAPVISFLHEDMRTLVESFRWQ